MVCSFFMSCCLDEITELNAVNDYGNVNDYKLLNDYNNERL